MTTILVIFVAALVLAVVGTRIAIFLGRRFGALDRPDGYRKIHPRAVPRLGGPVIFLAFFIPLIPLIWYWKISNVSWVLLERPLEVLGLFVGAALVLVLGLVDDKLDLAPRWKFASQIAIAFIACAFGFLIRGVTNPFGGTLLVGIFAYPITVLWFVACMNAVNLADGMDGLAAGICFFVSLTLFFLSLELANVLGLLLMACLAGSLLGFLLFNFPPAKIFLGNSGSMLLGFLIAALSVIASRKAEAALALFIPVVALGLPIMDTALALVRRWYHHLPIATPDREHIHHALVSMGYSHRRAVLILYGLCATLGLVAIVLALARSEIVILVIIFLLAMIYVSIRIFGGITLRDLLQRLLRGEEYKEWSRRAHEAVARATVEMADTTEINHLWIICCRTFESLQLRGAILKLQNLPPSSQGHPVFEGEIIRRWATDSVDESEPAWTLVLPLQSEAVRFGELSVSANVADIPLGDFVELLERFRAALSNRLVVSSSRRLL